MDINTSVDMEKSSPNEDSLEVRVAADLGKYLDRFSNRSFAIRNLAKETDLSERTLKRLLAMQNLATYQTLFKLYSVFLNETDFSKLMDSCPKVVAQYLAKFTPTKSVTTNTKNKEFLNMIRDEPLLGEIYILASTGPIQVEHIVWNYGQYGCQLVERLVDMHLLKALDKNTYVASVNGPNFDGPALKLLGEYFVRKFAKAGASQEMDQNAISFYAEGLNEQGKKQWLAIDTEAFYKKLQIANSPVYRGSIPVFTFTVTDTISKDCSND